jgi:hypothetical protein
MQPILTPTIQRFMREYASYRAFSKDAQALYVHTHYTIEHTDGLAHRGLKASLRFFQREFSTPPRQHLIISYVSPTIQRPGDVAPAGMDSPGMDSRGAGSTQVRLTAVAQTGTAAVFTWLTRIAGRLATAFR